MEIRSLIRAPPSTHRDTESIRPPALDRLMLETTQCRDTLPETFTMPDCVPTEAADTYSPDDHATRNSGYKVNPPHAKIVCPVIYELSSDARNAKTAAISSAVPARPIGM